MSWRAPDLLRVGILGLRNIQRPDLPFTRNVLDSKNEWERTFEATGPLGPRGEVHV